MNAIFSYELLSSAAATNVLQTKWMHLNFKRISPVFCKMPSILVLERMMSFKYGNF